MERKFIEAVAEREDSRIDLEITNPSELDEIPRYARAAFALRCVRRLLPLYRVCWPDAPPEYTQAIEQAITLGEAAVATANAEGAAYAEIAMEAAKGTLQHWQAKKVDDYAHGGFDGSKAAANIALAASYAEGAAYAKSERGTTNLVVRSVKHAVMTLCVYSVLQNPSHPSEIADGPIEAMFSDLDRLRVAADDQGWTAATPLHINFFGPLWPAGVPTGWPSEEGRGSVRDPIPLSSLDQALAELRRRNEEIDNALEPITASFQRVTLDLEGRNFESLEANQRVAQVIQDTADRLRVAFSCPKCGEPARFRCSAAATAKTGMFVFSHGRQTHGGGTKIPKLVVVDAPEDGRKTEIPDKET